MLAKALPKKADAADCATVPVGPPVPSARAAAAPRPTGIPSVETLRGLFPDLDILDLLGAGGMGAVYKARQPRLNRLVALKIMVCPPGHEVDFALRFEREAQVLARLSHPHIVIIHDFGDIPPERTGGDPIFYFIMEHVDGTDLGQLIKSKELKPAQALAIVPQICDALQYAHDQGITHRDIKPANILIDKRGTVKIADFGLAKMVGAAADPFMTGLTQTGTAMGTPHYMAPEQWEDPQHVDHRADIYALGVVFYEMLTGERPAGVFEPPSKKTKPPVDKKLDGVVMRAMDKNPERRYQQAGQIGEDVTRISGANTRKTPATASPQAASATGRRNALLALGTAAALAVGGWVLWPEEERKKSGAGSEGGVAVTSSDVLSFGGHRYQLVEGKYTWEQARARATEMGGHLATFTTTAEQDAVHDGLLAAQGKDAPFWLGGFAEAQSRDVRWITGEPFGKLRWGIGHPGWREDANSDQVRRDGLLCAAGVAVAKAGAGNGALNVLPMRYDDLGFIIEWDDASGRAAAPPAAAVAGSNDPGPANAVLAGASAAPTAPFTDREAAEWALAYPAGVNAKAGGAKVGVKLRAGNGPEKLVTTLAELPKEPFTVTAIYCEPPDEQKGNAAIQARIREEDVVRLAGLKTVRELFLYGKLGGPSLAAVMSLPALEALYINGDQLTAGDLAVLKGAKLKDLGFYDFTVRDAKALEVLRTMPALSLLFFNGGADPALVSALPALPALQRLRINFSPGLTDEALTLLAAKFPALDEFNLARCRNVNGTTLGALKSLTKLGLIDLIDTKVDDAALSALRGTKIPRLKLPYTRITDASVPVLASLPLIELDIGDTFITDAGLAKLAAIPTLKRLSLNIYRTAGFTAEGVAAFQKLRPDVEVPSVRKAPGGAKPPATAEGSAAAPSAAAMAPADTSSASAALAGASALPPASALPVKPGRLRGSGFHLDGKPLDLKKAEGISDFVQVILTDRGWVGLRATGDQVTPEEGWGEKNIARLLPAWFNSYGTINREGRLSIQRQASEEVKAIPADVQRIGVVDACWDGGQAIALLKDGTVRVWGEHYTRDHEGPKWPAPPAEALQNVRKIAITHWRAATLRHDGKWHIWGGHGGSSGPFDLADFQQWGEIADIATTFEPFRVLARDGKLYNLGGSRPLSGGLVTEGVAAIYDHLVKRQGAAGWSWLDPSRANAQPEVDALLKQIGDRPRGAFDIRIVGDLNASNVAAVWIEPVE